MARFKRSLREQIVREFTARHGGLFDPEAFVLEVKRKGAEHPAYEWFEWDEEKAATAYWIEQARDFVRDLKVTFSVEIIGRNQSITIREMDAPFAISPLGARRGGGGYYLTDPTNPEHMAELCDQARRDLDAWLRRYSAAAAHVGMNVAPIERLMSLLGSAGHSEEQAA